MNKKLENENQLYIDTLNKYEEAISERKENIARLQRVWARDLEELSKNKKIKSGSKQEAVALRELAKKFAPLFYAEREALDKLEDERNSWIYNDK